MNIEWVCHPIEPVWDLNSKVLILGSFPSVKSRETKFYYGHPQNKFWRVLSAVLSSYTPLTIDEKKAMLKANRIALWDVIASCDVRGSADSSIKNVVPNDVNMIIKNSQIQSIFVNGGTAARLYDRYLLDFVGIGATKLPSTSSANASWTFERLCEEWRVVARELNK